MYFVILNITKYPSSVRFTFCYSLYSSRTSFDVFANVWSG